MIYFCAFPITYNNHPPAHPTPNSVFSFCQFEKRNSKMKSVRVANFKLIELFNKLAAIVPNIFLRNRFLRSEWMCTWEFFAKQNSPALFPLAYSSSISCKRCIQMQKIMPKCDRRMWRDDLVT